MADATVKFNVGGVIYQVRKSLIEQFPSTVMARAVSDEWKKDNHKEPIFIERDPGRFRYCLDYMRDKKVALPHTESKATFLTDLEYLGFDQVDDDRSITVEQLPVSAALKTMTLFDYSEDEALKKMKLDIEGAEKRIVTKELAIACSAKFRQSRSYAPTAVRISQSEYPNLFIPLTGAYARLREWDDVLLNDFLGKGGLAHFETPTAYPPVNYCFKIRPLE